MEIVELPPFERKVEWPTVALAVAIYGMWLAATLFWARFSWALPVFGPWIIAWQMNLQHETIHGHPTRLRWINEAIGVWPLALWLPYATYRATHRRHHQDQNLTDPFEDPESYYWTEAGWRDLKPLGRALVRFQSTLLGRMLVGPAWMMSGSIRNELRAAWTGRPRARTALFWHLVQCAPVVIWVMGVCRMPLWLYVVAFIYPGMSLAMVRSFAEHRAAPAAERRTAIVEDAWLLGPLFLFNNLHVAHHMRGGIPWYLLPRFYRLNRAALIERNGGLVYRSYFDVARRYLLKPHDEPIHPGWVRNIA